MFEKFRRKQGHRDEPQAYEGRRDHPQAHEARQDTPPGGMAPVGNQPEAIRDDRTMVADRPARGTAVRDRTDLDARDRRTSAPLAADALAERRERQRREFGGLDWPAAFFGWLVAIGLGTLLVAILGATGAAIGISQVDDTGDAAANADTIGIVGGVLLLVALLIAYFAGGYVAGRMARFDGMRQGIAVWFIALAVTVALAVAGLVLGAEYNIFQQLDLPRIPVDEGTLTTGGIIALAAVALGTLIAAALGGKAGERYHRRIDRFAD